ncbi:MAG: hypothetical protein J0L70_23625 [Leptolyngbya sp. UWPOB_LEPTO1]|nr:hypothetical protein [Leptolyngbya sp. UWPOB_LEPTO1]MBN8563533.1 hypothetical protein [Leptolyngbya sp. UWPOB_LEPTO1]
MEEISAINDLVMNFEPTSAPMTIAAWLILVLMLGLVDWGFWAERRD